MSILSGKKANTAAAEAQSTAAAAEQSSVRTGAKKRTVGRLEARRSSGSVSVTRLMSKGAFAVAGGLVALMGVSFAASALLTSQGSFSIRAEQIHGKDGRGVRAIALSETMGFSNSTVNLTAGALDDMDNITYDWLPLEELDARDGSHNGENYINYTFYMKNAGEEEIDYSTALEITKCTRNIDAAIRVIIYKNGVPTIYAKPGADGYTEPYPEDVVDFYDDRTVMYEVTTGSQPGDVDRYSVVVWLEGEDPECVDLVRGGTMKLEMVFKVLSEEDEETAAEASGEETAETVTEGNQEVGVKLTPAE